LYIFSVVFAILFFSSDQDFFKQASVLSFSIATIIFGVIGLTLLQDFVELIRETIVKKPREKTKK